MNKIVRFYLSILILFTFAIPISAQQVGSNSPYGRYGFGVLSNQSIGASEAMGGISYGVRRSQQVNPGNPASYSELDTLTFIFDFGLSGYYAEFSDGINKEYKMNGNLDYVAMQFPIVNKVGASVGLLPYSKVGYSFGQTKSLSNIVYDEIFRGDGGLSQIYGGIAYEPFKYLSVGANISYIFGSYRYSNVSVPKTASSSTVGEERKSFSIRDIKYDLGLQLTYPINNEKKITLGAVYTPQLDIKADVYATEMMYTSDPYANPYQAPKEVLRDDTLSAQKFQLPHTLGVGVTYSNKNLLVGLDGTFQQWKGLNYPDVLDGMGQLASGSRFNNVFRMNGGAEYVIDPYSRNFFHRIRFRGGLSYANSYNNVSVYTPDNSSFVGVGGFKEYGVSVGLGLPLMDNIRRRLSMLNVTFTYTLQDPEMKHMIKQDVFEVAVNMNVNENWFFKNLFN